MTIPKYLVDSARRHREAGRRAALIVRHAERHPISTLRGHEAVLLTDRGHEQARIAGQMLAEIASTIRVVHSVVMRCEQTARGIVEGARAAGADAALVGATERLAAPFIKDKERALALAEELGHGFIRAWFNDTFPDVFEPRSAAAHGQLDVVAEHLASSVDDTLWVFVSHDWNVALVREELLGVRPEDRWPQFLDGVAIGVQGEEMIVELEEKSGIRSSTGPKRAR